MKDPLDDFPVLNEATVAGLLTWDPLIDAVGAAFVAFSAGEVTQPVRQILSVPGQDGLLASMPAAGSAVAVKLVTLYHSNAGTDLPTHQGVIVLFDAGNGTPLALMDGRLITEMRTAAGSAVMARRLAPPAPKIMTILGNGVQARSHAAALRAVRDVPKMRLWARDPQKGAALAHEIGAEFVADAELAVRDADIVACTTAATRPILKGAWLKPGAFVAAVGWNGADARELDDEAMSGTIIVESREAALDQSGNVRGSGASIFAEAGEILTGQKRVPDGATVIYDSIGMAIMDVAAAQLVYENWRTGR
ncbi:MAG: ornithine cyclodeaminase family protein [Marinibacterium sp.]